MELQPVCKIQVKEEIIVLTLIRGGGDLASGVAYRLFRAGIAVVITEIPQPLMVRRLVSFGEAVYRQSICVEGVTARMASTTREAGEILAGGEIAVIIDPQAEIRAQLHPEVIIDGRMTKQPPDLPLSAAPLVIGLGPGCIAGVNCHAAVETNRGHFLGRAIWEGSTQADTGIPGEINSQKSRRVLRAQRHGILEVMAEIGDLVQEGQLLAKIEDQDVRAPFQGTLRGIARPGIQVWPGLKIGDVDPRADPVYAHLISDKSLAIGGGVLEAILTRPDLRRKL
jgi:xanthine dehydrogenase accessory factor